MNFDKTAKFYFDLQSRIRRRRRGVQTRLSWAKVNIDSLYAHFY